MIDVKKMARRAWRTACAEASGVAIAVVAGVMVAAFLAVRPAADAPSVADSGVAHPVVLPTPTSPTSTPAPVSVAASPHPAAAKPASVQFEPNLGQAARGARYVAQASGFRAEVHDDGLRLTEGAASARLRFVGARTVAGGKAKADRFDPRERADGVSNYLVGTDRTKWLREVPRFRQLRQAGVYPGIDLVYYGRDGALEYDLVVHPGADPSPIRIAVSAGPSAPSIEANGDLLLDGPGGRLRMHRPVLYQHVDGTRRTLEADYVLLASNEIGFRLPEYDRTRPLVIDPTFKLLYSTYLGGVHDDQVGAMTIDALGNAYVVGNSGSEDFPVSGNAYQASRKALGRYVRNVVVTKFDASGTLVYSTFLGGTTNDYGNGIAVDASGRAIVVGATDSSDFPTTANAFQTAFRGSQSAFVAMLSGDGSSLVTSSLLGGSGGATAMSVQLDPAGVAVVGGSAGSGLPTTAGVFQSTVTAGTAAFLARFDLNATGAAQLLAATYYGAAAPQTNYLATGNAAYTMALDPSGTPWITGQAYTANLPITAGAVQALPPAMTPGCSPGSVPLNSFAYVAHLSADLKTLVYASYLTGGNGGPATCAEYGHGLAFDAAGNVYVGGSTSSRTFPTTAGVPQPASPANSGFDGYSGYITKLKADGSAILWSTYLGGDRGRSYLNGLANEPSGAAVWAWFASAGGSNFPISADALQRTHGGGTFDAAYSRLDANTGAVLYSTYMGGAGDDGAAAFAIDASGTAYVAGTTASTNFPVSATPFQPALTANAYDGADWFFSIVGSGTIGQVRPAVAGNGGDVTFAVSGVGFEAGATVSLELTGATTLTAATVGVNGDTSLSAAFSLAGATPGRYDLVVRNPSGSVLRRAGAVNVTAGGQPEVWANVIGRPAIRTGVTSTFNVVVGNSGSVDAYFTRLWISFPSTMTYAIADGVTDPDVPGLDLTSLAAENVTDEGRTYIPVIIPLIRAGSTETLPLGLTSSADSDGLQVSAFVRPPWFDSRQGALSALAAARAAPGTLSSVCQYDAAKPAVRNCLGEYLNDTSTTVAGMLSASLADTAQPPSDAAPDPAIVAQIQVLAVDNLSSLLTASIAANGVRPPGPRIATSAKGDPRLRNPVLVGVAAAVGLWLLSKLGDWLFNKTMDAIVKPPVVDPTQDPRFVRKTTDKSPCRNGQLTVTETYYFKNPAGTKTKTYHEECGKECPKGSGGSKPAISYAAMSIPGVPRLAKSGTCPPPPPPPPNSCPNPHNNGGGSGGGSCSGSGGSIDPNDKFGTSGDGTDAHWIRPSVPLAYQVAFENQPTASLPAAQVVITDRLDPAQVDLSTLALGNIGWGSFRIDVPPGLKSYATTKPVDATMSVRAQGSVDPTTGVLKWTLTTIDPLTKLPPSDPTLGFLPPDSDGVKGQGYVAFTVQPKAGIADGTAIRNLASIVFDANAPIVTPTWANLIDSTPPTSRVQSLTGRAGELSFDVAWSSPADAGSAVRSYTVSVSDNGGPYTAWLTATSATSATYPGVDGHTYAFRSIAVDGAGNSEAAKTGAEATIAVDGVFGGGAGGGDDGSGGGGGCTVGGPGQRDATLPIAVLLAACGVAFARRRRAAAYPVAGGAAANDDASQEAA